jgi:WD40 repeat protein
MAGSGGRIGIWSTKEIGRLPPRIYQIVNDYSILEFAFDPFDEFIFYTAGEDGKIKRFKIPGTKLDSDLVSAQSFISAHSNRITVLEPHPTISSMILSASQNNLKIWNALDWSCIHSIDTAEPIMTAAFDVEGKYVAVLTKDVVNLYNLSNAKIISTWPTHKGAKGARLVHLEKNEWCSIGFGL